MYRMAWNELSTRRGFLFLPIYLRIFCMLKVDHILMEFSIGISYQWVHSIYITHAHTHTICQPMNTFRLNNKKIRGTQHAFKWYLNDHGHSSTPHRLIYLFNLFLLFCVCVPILIRVPVLPFAICHDLPSECIKCLGATDSVDILHWMYLILFSLLHSIDIYSYSLVRLIRRFFIWF